MWFIKGERDQHGALHLRCEGGRQPHMTGREEGVRVSFSFPGDQQRHPGHEAILIVKEMLEKSDVGWITPGYKEWSIGLDKLKKTFQELSKIDWLRGEAYIEPEFEATTIGSREVAVVFYIVPDVLPLESITEPVQYALGARERWKNIRELDSGGQGRVHLVLDTSKVNPDHNLYPTIVNSIRRFQGFHNQRSTKNDFELFHEAIVGLIRTEDFVNLGALKKLHDPEDARDAARAEERIKREIQAMSRISHPNLLKILDHNPKDKWFVSEFYPRGTLIDNKNLFTGNFVASLRALRPLVEGVAQLHKNGIVHRDIKPKNIFLDLQSNLVLGDFGLIFFTDDQHTRISGTFENVGSRDWMPPWAREKKMKIEDVRPSFDVFSLGKVLWSMVSTESVLPFWEYERPEFNLEVMFPEAKGIKFANELFKKCIVRNDRDCLRDAADLLEEIDEILSLIDKNADLVSPDAERPCRVCGKGEYKIIVDQDNTQTRNFGFDPTGTSSYKIFVCTHCGHVQLFYFAADDRSPPAWSD